METSPTMHRLLTLMGDVRKKRDGLESQFKSATDDEAMSEHRYRQAHAMSMLQSEQKTEGMRQAEAEIATEQLALQRRLSIGLRRSAAEALKGCHDDSETLQAAFHAYNREMKMATEFDG